jgi:hypothetical protein
MLSYDVGLKRKASSSEGAFFVSLQQVDESITHLLRGLEIAVLKEEDMPIILD